jgi:hypothetical protein
MQTTIHPFVTVLFTFVFLFLESCSGKPSTRNMTQAMKNKLANLRGCDRLILVDNLRKLKGWDVNDRHYTAQISYDLVLKRDVEIPWSPNLLGLDDANRCVYLIFKTGIHPAGSKIHINSNQLKYVKTEKEWIPQ